MSADPSRRRSERDALICRLRESGATLQEIADEVGCTRERVRQILKKAGGPTAAELRARRARAVAENAEAVQASVRTFLVDHPGSSVLQIATGLGLTEAAVRRSLPSDLRALVTEEPREEPPVGKERVVVALCHASTYEFPLTAAAYRRLQESGEVDGPSLPRIWQLFGSWSSACNAAGVECGKTPRAEYSSKWTDDDILGHINDYLRARGSTGSVQGYTEWRAQNAPDAPSAPLVRIRFGSWTNAKRAALGRTSASEFPT